MPWYEPVGLAYRPDRLTDMVYQWFTAALEGQTKCRLQLKTLTKGLCAMQSPALLLHKRLWRAAERTHRTLAGTCTHAVQTHQALVRQPVCPVSGLRPGKAGEIHLHPKPTVSCMQVSMRRSGYISEALTMPDMHWERENFKSGF